MGRSGQDQRDEAIRRVEQILARERGELIPEDNDLGYCVELPPGYLVQAPPRRRGWLLLLALLFALPAGVVYFWRFSEGYRGPELLEFTALWVACPLALAVLAVFAYFRYPAKG